MQIGKLISAVCYLILFIFFLEEKNLSTLFPPLPPPPQVFSWLSFQLPLEAVMCTSKVRSYFQQAYRTFFPLSFIIKFLSFSQDESGYQNGNYLAL